MNRTEYMLGGLICEHCGKITSASQIKANDACWTCQFWLGYMEEDKQLPETFFITESFNHYAIGDEHVRHVDKGFGGSVAEIVFPNGKMKMTSNLWSQGIIPERFRDKWPVRSSTLVWK